jgi:hypothetical protein
MASIREMLKLESIAKILPSEVQILTSRGHKETAPKWNSFSSMSKA